MEIADKSVNKSKSKAAFSTQNRWNDVVTGDIACQANVKEEINTYEG